MKKYLFLVAAAVAFWACGNEDDPGKTPTPPAPEASLEVSPLELVFAAEGEAKSITLTSNVDWKITASSDWLEFSPESGVAAENVSVTVTAAENAGEEARTATLTVTAGKLKKTVNVSQDALPVEPEQPQPSNANFTISDTPVRYADDLEDGKRYVIFNNFYSTKMWKEADGKLTLAENADSEYSSVYVFEFKRDDSQLNTTFDNYGNFSSGAWKSMSTGKYLDAEFNLDAELANALYLEYANNWGNTGAANEIDVLDVYKCPIDPANIKTLWYANDEFAFGDMNYAYEGGSGTPKRKWVLYEATEVQQ